MDKAGRMNISAWKWHLRARKKLVAAWHFDRPEWKVERFRQDRQLSHVKRVIQSRGDCVVGAIPAVFQPVTSQQLC